MKSMTTDQNAAVILSNIKPVYFVQFDFPEFTRYTCTALRTVTWNGHQWEGYGAITKISPYSFSADLESNAIHLQMSGVSEAMVALALDPSISGSLVRAWVGWANDNDELIDTPVQEFHAWLDVPTVQQNIGTDGTIERFIGVIVEGRKRRASDVNMRRNTNAEQQHRYPGDLYNQYTARMMNATLAFPGKAYFQ